MTTKPKSLADKAILVKLSISRYAARVQDNESREVVSTQHNSSPEAYSVTKRLLNPKNEIVAKVTTTINQIKRYHRDNTVPWDYDGTGVIRSTKYPKYAQQMRQLFAEYHNAINQFTSEFIKLKDEAKAFLGSGYNEDDYPSLGELTQKFKIDLEVLPVPQSGDFRVDLPAETMEEISKNIESKEQEKMKNMAQVLAKRVYEPIKHVVEILSNDQKIYGSLLENVEKIIDAIPDLNVTEDTSLNDIRQEIEEKLLNIPIDEIRGSDYVKGEAKETAKELAKKIREIGEIDDDDELLKLEIPYGTPGPKPVYRQKNYLKEEKKNGASQNSG